MKNNAIVIIYSGDKAGENDLRNIVEFFAKNSNCITNAQQVEVFSLTGAEIARGVTIQAAKSVPTNEVEEAAKFIGKHFANSISASVPTFAANLSTVYVNVKLKGNHNEEEQALLNAVRILGEMPDSGMNLISSTTRRKYGITLAIINALKDVYGAVCQGHIGTWL